MRISSRSTARPMRLYSICNPMNCVQPRNSARVFAWTIHHAGASEIVHRRRGFDRNRRRFVAAEEDTPPVGVSLEAQHLLRKQKLGVQGASLQNSQMIAVRSKGGSDGWL
jgi:hypothetical protein